MIIKIKPIMMIFVCVFDLCIVVVFSMMFISGSGLTLYEWYIFIISIIFIFLSFSLPTKRITLTPEKFSGYWKIVIGPIKIYESNHYQFYWKNVNGIYAILPLWLPLKAIGISATRNGRPTLQIFGYGYTKRRESLTYIADHVSPEVIGPSVQKLIKKYRRQLAKKGNNNDIG